MTKKQLDIVIRGLEWLVAIMMVLNLNSVYHTILNSNIPTMMDMFLYVLIGLLGLASIYKMTLVHRFDRKLLIFIGMYGVLSMMFIILNLTVSHSTSQQIFINFVAMPILLIAYFSESFYEDKQLSILAKIEKVIFGIACISLFFWTFGSLLQLIKASSTVEIFWGPGMTIPSFWGLYFETQDVSVLGHVFVRNTAIFTEAPMYGCLLALAVIYNVFVAKKRISQNKVLVLAAITTGSVTGIATIFATLGLKFYQKMIKSNVIDPKSQKRVKLLTNTALSLVIIAIIIVVGNRVMYGAASVSARLNDINAGIRAWLLHPIIGNGVGNYVSITDYMTPSRLAPNGNSGFSSGLASTLAYGGAYWASFFLVPVIGIIIRTFRGTIEIRYTCYALFALLLLSFTIVNNTLMFVLISMFEWGLLLFNLTKEKNLE